MRILIADDALDVAQVVAFGAQITWPGCEVQIANNGADALKLFEAARPDLVVLDIEMPPPDGLEVCKRIREIALTPILMLTVRDSTLDKVLALDIGADDYLTKPFNHSELLARMRALVRRSTGPISAQSVEDLTMGEFAINFASHEVRMCGQVVPLTSTEYRLLEELVRSAGTAISHRALLKKVWGPEYAGEVHYLKIFVRRLRQKLGDDAERPRFIQTEWGIGYRFASPQEIKATPFPVGT
jgi:two-component system KDP operon response regulator KdpE